MLRQLASTPARLAVRGLPSAGADAGAGARADAGAGARAAVSRLAASAVSSRPLSIAARASRPCASAFLQQQQQQRQSAVRWYGSEASEAGAKAGEDAKKAEPADGEAAAAGGEGLTAAEAAALRSELEAKNKEVLEWKDKFLRSVADFRNLQERTQRDMKSARDFAITQFARDLVDSVDNLDRALSIVPEKKADEAAAADAAADDAAAATSTSTDLANLIDGLKMTETVLLQTLKKHGLERFDPAGEKFNPNEHEATFMTPMPDKEHNTVFHTQQKGFRLNGRVVRAAKVGVVNNK